MANDFNSSRYYLNKIVEEIATSIKKDSMVLDAGAGDCLYKPYFMHAKYEAADYCVDTNKAYELIDYKCNLNSIPVENDRYDLILFLQVLEHIATPNEVLKELYRVLKPGGRLIISVPFFYEEHDIPHDYYRYTQFGLTHIIETNGFKIINKQWLEGYFGTLSYFLKHASLSIPINPENYGKSISKYVNSFFSLLIVRPFFSLLSRYFYFLDKKNKYTKSGFCKNYIFNVEK